VNVGAAARSRRNRSPFRRRLRDIYGSGPLGAGATNPHHGVPGPLVRHRPVTTYKLGAMVARLNGRLRHTRLRLGSPAIAIGDGVPDRYMRDRQSVLAFD